ncbi:S-adenosyl-L-methionine-dependent methyltransferase [Mycena sanguinolenta]|uniref:S-adenosyl-L-methionine-dependent methyltransferase n=1 Tax=Mycena sanguinolenta TaxID=230812 RepID=A0A8H6Z4T5_9AGAR|nr:S-adenosyl-L-methionine-dependent methyltransferase [Mycena sanguinolenta]
MATFAKRTFDAARYAVSRPTYPRALYESVLAYHEQSLEIPGTSARWDHVVDLGCGTGQATAELLQVPQVEADLSEEDERSLGFTRATGIDPSSKMIEEATAHAATLGARGASLKFVQSPAESLGFLQDQSVDMVVAAQAAHWFDWDRLWPELSRVLRHGGTVAFWIYSEFRLPQYPHLTPLITEYAQGSDPATSIGPYWEPGRRILNNHLLDIQAPPSGWDDLTRAFFTGAHYPDLPQPHLEPIMRKTMTWGGAGLHGYLNTFSALHKYHETFPEDLQRSDGDIATRFLRSLMAGAQVPEGPEGEAQEVEVEWPMALVVARKELDPEDPWRQRQVTLYNRVGELRKAWEQKTAALPPPANLEETSDRLDQWVASQADVLELVAEDMMSLPEEVDPKYEDGRERYINALEEHRSTLSWQQSFKESFDAALMLALQTEQEIGTEDCPAALARWLELMRERVKEVGGPLYELDKEAENELDDEVVAQLSEEQLLGYEKAEALDSIIRVAEELADAVPNEPISDLVRGLYISASAEVTKQVEFDE